MFINIILGLIILIFAGIALSAFLFAHAESEERKKTEKELKEVKEHEERAAEIITEANQTKADARTGNHERDFNYIADKLHDLAKK